MAKKLNLALIKEDIKKFDEKKKVTLKTDKDGEEIYLNIFPNFSNEKMTDMVKEVIEDEIEAPKMGIEFDKINKSDWLFFNVIRYFTDLSIPRDIKKKVQVYTNLRKSDYFVKIIEEFPEESMNKFAKVLEKVGQNLTAFNNMNENQLKTIAENVIEEELKVLDK